MAESPLKMPRVTSHIPSADSPSSSFLSAMSVLALLTYTAQDVSEFPVPPVGGGGAGGRQEEETGGARGFPSWPSQLDDRKKLLFMYGDCLLPFLLTCKAASGLKDDVFLPFSITPLGPHNRTPLMAAARRNDLPLLRRMCEAAKGWDLDVRDCDKAGVLFPGNEEDGGNTALTHAAAKGNREAARMLLSAGASLSKAFSYASLSIAKEMIGHPDILGEIIDDAPLGFSQALSKWRKYRAKRLHTLYDWSKSRIIEAAFCRIPELVRALYVAGNTEDELDDYLWNGELFIYKDEPRRKETVRAFAEHPTLQLKHRASAAGVTQNADWLRELAAITSRQEFFDFVFPAAAEAGALDLVQRAIKMGCDVNKSCHERCTPAVYLAAKQKHYAVVELLACSDGMKLDKALLAASGCGLTSLAKKILDRGANIEYWGVNDEEDGWFDNPLCAAIEGGHVATVCLLLDEGATTVFQNENYNDCPPLIFACDLLQTEIVRVLLEQDRADVDETEDMEGKTSLMAVSDRWNRAKGADELEQTREVEIVQILLEHGASREAVSDSGKTALDYATQNNHSHIANVLRDRTIGAATHGRL